MGTLTGKQIDNTYDGLIKTDDEQPISATPKRLQDGLGNDLPVKVGTGGMAYNGVQDFTDATVTGISATDTTYTLGVDESVPDGVITLTASDGSPIQEVTFQCNGNIVMDVAPQGQTLDVTVEPYDLTSSQDGADVDINLNSTYGGSNVTLEAGTNITLTNTGNNILIDAAGGAGTDTTYDFAAAQVGANSKLALTGSDATIDAVTLVAGNNVTLTTVGSDVTIDAAGGGGGTTVFKLGRYTGTQALYPCDTIQASVLIPAGTVLAGDIWELRAMEEGRASTGFIYTAFWISTDGTIGNSGNETVGLGQAQTPDSDWAAGYHKAVYVHTADGTGAGSTTWRAADVSDVAMSGPIGGGDTPQTWQVDWTVDNYLVSRICIDNPGAIYTMHGATFHKIG